MKHLTTRQTVEEAVRRWLSTGRRRGDAFLDVTEALNDARIRHVDVDGHRVFFRLDVRKHRRLWFRAGKGEEARAWLGEHGWSGGSLRSFLIRYYRANGPWPEGLFNAEAFVAVRAT